MCSASSAAEGEACAETSHAVVDRGGTAGNTKTVASLLLQVEGLSRLVEHLRTLSLAIGQKLVMDRERFELADLVDAVLDAAKPMLDASKLAVEKELVPMEAVADCQCIRQAMLALLENSCRFAASGGRRKENKGFFAWLLSLFGLGS